MPSNIATSKFSAGSIRKGTWAPEEDRLLVALVTEQRDEQESLPENSGEYKVKFDWKQISQGLKTRSGKQCRERWVNHLNPGIIKSKWTPEEDERLLTLGQRHARRWAQIARDLPGRSQNQVKIRWNSLNHVSNKRKSSKRKLQRSTKRKFADEKESPKAFKPLDLPDANSQQFFQVPNNYYEDFTKSFKPLVLPEQSAHQKFQKPRYDFYGGAPTTAPAPTNPYNINLAGPPPTLEEAFLQMTSVNQGLKDFTGYDPNYAGQYVPQQTLVNNGNNEDVLEDQILKLFAY